MKIVIACFSLFILTVGLGIYQDQSSSWACKELKPKYFEVFTTKSGFFKDLELVVVDVQEKTLGVMPHYQVGFEINKVYYIDCKDLKRLE